jgi:tetratricopeptide (TPR) repeat protein
MVTGRVPFEGDTPLSVAYKHKNELPIAPRKLNSHVPEPLNKVILRCLEKEKADRYQTAEELLSDLALVEEGLPITERVAPKTRVTAQRSALKATGLRRFLVPALAGLGIVIAAFVFWRILPKKRPPGSAFASGKPSIAILNFENLSGDPALDILREGLARLINSGLAQSKLIYVLDPSGLYGILKKLNLDRSARYTRDDLVKVADEGGVSYISTGSLMKAGKDIVIMLTLQKPRTGEVIDSFKLTCRSEEEIYSNRPDELVAKIKSAMELSPAQVASDKTLPISQITSKSPEALRYYMESLESFRQLDYMKMKGLLEKAVERDPGFAQALTLLGVSYECLGDYAKGREFRKKAYELRDRLSERDRYQVEGEYYLTLPGEYSRAKAIEALERYLEYAPRDAGELQSLGMCYRNSGDYTKALDYFKRSYETEPSPQYLLGLLRSYNQTGQFEKYEETLKEFYRSNEVNVFVQDNAAWFYISRRQFDQAMAEIERGFLQDPSWKFQSWDILRGAVYLARGDMAEAETEYLRVVERAANPDYVLQAKSSLIALYILQGRLRRIDDVLRETLVWQGTGSAPQMTNVFLRLKDYKKASEIVERFLSVFRRLDDPPGIRKGLWWKGILAVEKKDIGEAEKIAEELRISAQKSPYKNEMQKVDHLQGLIDLGKGEYIKAIDNLNKACAWLASEDLSGWLEPHTLHYYPLALAYYKAGNLPKARAEFDRVTNLMSAKFDFGDLYAKSFYWLGKIAEAQKDKKRAVENYGKFLELWKDADPGQPEVDDARKRVDILR